MHGVRISDFSTTQILREIGFCNGFVEISEIFPATQILREISYAHFGAQKLLFSTFQQV